MKKFPESMQELSNFYAQYVALIRRGVWYVDRHSFYGRAVPSTKSWAVRTRLPSLNGSRAPYWLPEPSAIREQMRDNVHRQQRNGDISSAAHAHGTPRTREEFSRFPVGYNYDEQCVSMKARSAKILGDALVEDNVRLFDFDVGRRVATVELATYLDQRATNLNPDNEFVGTPIPYGQKRTFRELDSDQGALLPLKRCTQANTIGIACTLIGADGVPVMTLRSKDTAVMNDGSSWHCSSSGALTWDDLTETSPQMSGGLLQGLVGGMRRELREELELEPHEYELVLTDFARELPRAGKPQFFFVARSSQTAPWLVEVIARRTKKAVSEHAAVGAWERNREPPNPLAVFYQSTSPEEGVAADPNLRFQLVADGTIHYGSRRFTYEGFAALLFAAQFLAAGTGGAG